MIRSRLAPTPSGYLHLGNALNFILTWLSVRRRGGVLKLRIDDGDADRSRPEYVEDIFRQLEWLGLDWDEGPSGPADFAAHHSQLRRLERYRTLLAELKERGHLFFCTCSRRRISQLSASGLYPGTCRKRATPPPAPHTIRLRLPEGWTVILPELESFPGQSARRLHRPAAELGDFILWRRDNLPAYQLASLADDLADGINFIVRGRDLLPSSAGQLFLAAQLGEIGAGFCRAAFLHHPLLTATDGRKLAKSDRDLSLAAMRGSGISPAEIHREAARFLGLDPGTINNLEDLRAALPPAVEESDLGAEIIPDGAAWRATEWGAGS